MQEKLVILLHADDLTRPSYAVLASPATVTNVVQHANPDVLSEIAKDRAVIVIVPSEDVLLTTVTLPKMNRSRLLQAIPYALEEQIIDDVESMHFAAGDYRANEALPVAVVTRTKMSEWLDLLHSWGVMPDSMIPSVFALPVSAGNWTAQVSQVAMVRIDENSGFACDIDNLDEMLALALAVNEAPRMILLDECDTQPLILTVPVTVEQHQVTASQLLEVMAAQVAVAAPVNLLQGDYQNKKTRRMPKLTSVLKVGVYMLAFWLFMLFLYPVVSFAILDKRAATIKDQIAVIYKRQFPSASSVVAPRERMQQKLNKLSSDFGENRLLFMMANVGKGLAKSSGVTLKRMDYQSNVMTLELSAASSEIFSTFTDALMQQGLRVKQQNANLNGARVNATLQIE
jgi:general secretion pathway protein L